MDVVRRPRLLRVLAELARRDRPVTMMEFMELAGYAQDPAQELRADMENAKLIVVGERNEGSKRWKEISLTPLGQRIAEKVMEIDALAEEARKTDGRGYGEASRR